MDIHGGVATKISNCLIGGMNDLTNFKSEKICNYGICINYLENFMCPNLITITDTIFGWCLVWAVKFENGTMLTMRGCEIEQNGPLNEITSEINGGIGIFGNLNIEQNVGIINISECWFESNRGYSFYFNKGEFDQNTIFNFIDCHFLTSGNSNNYLGLFINSANYNTSKKNIVNLFGVNSNMTVPSGFPGSFRLISDTINIIGSTILNIDFSSSPNNVGSFI